MFEYLSILLHVWHPKDEEWQRRTTFPFATTLAALSSCVAHWGKDHDHTPGICHLPTNATRPAGCHFVVFMEKAKKNFNS